MDSSRVQKIFALAIIVVLVASEKARAQDYDYEVQDTELVALPQSMGAFGDSITAGMLANFSRRNANLPWIQSWFLLRSLTMAGLFKVKGLEKKELSWSAGYNTSGKVMSHARRLAAMDGSREFKVFNAAVSGDEALDVLNSQMPRLKEWSRSKLGQEFPDYMTVLIGANDVCAEDSSQMTSVAHYYARMEQVIAQMIEKSPRTRVMVSTLPNIERLREVAYGSRLWGWGALKKCEDAWKLVKLCPTLTTLSDPNERLKIKQRVDDYNLAIHDIARRYNGPKGNRIHVAHETFEVNFTADHLSMDCFHPNPAGQEALSAATWQASWWAQQWGHKEDRILASRMEKNSECEGERTREAANPQNFRMGAECSRWLYRTPASDRFVGRIDFNN